MKEKLFAIPEYTTAEDIKDLRKRLKLTQKEFADRLGVQLSALKKWEQDRVKMQKATWEKYFR